MTDTTNRPTPMATDGTMTCDRCGVAIGPNPDDPEYRTGWTIQTGSWSVRVDDLDGDSFDEDTDPAYICDKCRPAVWAAVRVAMRPVGQHHVCPMADPQDPTGRIAKWLTEARIAGYNDRELADMLSSATSIVVEQALRDESGDDGLRLADALDEMASNEEQTSPIDGRTK